MRLRNITATAAVAVALVTGGLTLASPASAATPAAQRTLVLKCTHPCSDPPGPGWRYIDNYFWASSCIEVGNRGINNRSWSRYQCYGSTWTNYDLWVI